ncbi:hypothetical protein SteCoe_21857 [Stentor coeruleus]|uniref:Uncharacterized protein n=1 Tax=Stentor coeruleus TaxID=5963 RepID=A0A1R2BNS5_9CILI|nr:hypothetical protein SteCoe_21857 [Stentor coeruleus]
MQSIFSVQEAEQSPTFMIKTASSNELSPPLQPKDRKTTLGLVKLRSNNQQLCVNWSIIPTNATSKKHQDLIGSLEQNINECLDQPIEVLEDKLFYLCYIYFIELGGIPPDPMIIEIFHMVNVIQEECTRPHNISNALITLSKISGDYMKIYDFLCNFVKLINDLSLIYGIINLYDYRFRFEQRIESVKILNLPSLFSDIINMEIIWMSFAVQKPPLCYVFNTQVKSLAKLLQDEFYKTLEVFMESNQDNLDNKDSIQTWLASKNLRLVEEYGFHSEPEKTKPMYQNLTQKVFNCFCFKTAFQASELKEQLFEFEKIFRHFEGVVLKSWYELEKFNN